MLLPYQIVQPCLDSISLHWLLYPDAKLVHYTLGTPCFHEFANTGMANDWHQERLFTDYCQQRIDLLDDTDH